jgi:hypothetical protein
MPKLFVLGALMWLCAASAGMATDAASSLKLPKSLPPSKLAPRTSTSSGNPCAAFGPGFMRVAGSDTCVKIGGSIDVGVGASTGGR